MAQLRMLDSKNNAEQRKVWKFSLIRMLYDRGYSRQDILNLYRFIDWVMVLPEGLDRAFWQELRQFEEEQHMSYVTTGERIRL
jgi:predicted DNA-binding ribbon-helix-helix protein